MKQVKKLLAMILTLATLIGIFSSATTVFAEEYNNYSDNKAYQETLLTEAVENGNEKAEIICEVAEKRDEYTKTYKRADGSFTTVLSKTPIHKLQNGEWVEIDNSLKSESTVIVNKNGAFDIEFPETISQNEEITISNGDDSISFSVNEIESAEAVVNETKVGSDNIVEKDLSKTMSEITYENVNNNTDLQYIVSSNSVKENIIVSNKESLKDTYTFNIEKGNLSVEIDKENNIVFKNDKNEIAFKIPAPVMTDADNAVSYDIDVEVKNADKSVIELVYTPSKTWLESEERVYPIVIDPVIEFPSSSGKIMEDTLIGYSSDNPDAVNENVCDSPFGFIFNKTLTNSDNTTTRVISEALIKINMDAFSGLKHPDIAITDVNFIADGNVADGNFLVKAIDGDWDCKTITYADVHPANDNEPVISYDDEIVDYHTGYSSAETDDNAGAIAFNITELFNQWLTGERNNDGFAVVAEENVSGVLYLDGFVQQINSNNKTYFDTYISIDYVDTSGANDSFEYLTQEIGRAGTANVNTFSRSLSLHRSDLGLDGLRMPVNLGFIYSPAIDSFYEYFVKLASAIEGVEIVYPELCGNNWWPSYCFYLLITENNQIQVFTNEGTLVTFNVVEETVTETDPETSLETTKTVKTFEAEDGSDVGYELELIDPDGYVRESNIKLILPSGEHVYFNNDGSISIREDTANSDGSFDEITVYYLSEELPLIGYITDGIGRIYAFDYDPETYLLKEIKCFNADETPIKAGTTDIDLKVTYGYDSNRNLTSVTYPDGETVTYSYDSNGNLVKVQNIDGYNIQYTYDSLGKVTNIAEYAGTTPGNSITLNQLSDNQVKVTDDFSGTQTYQFGKDGKLHYTFDEKGNYYKSDYAPANDENVFSSNDWKITSQNLLKNGSFETTSALSNSRAKYWSAEFETTDLPEQQVVDEEIVGCSSKTFGDKSYLISSENECTKFVSQTVDVSNTSAYTFSAFVRSETVGALTLKITGINSSNIVDKSAVVTVDSTKGWQRYSVTYKPSENFVPKEIRVSFGFENSCGTYYIDCAQLESGLGTAEYNLIENGTFNNTDEYWSESTIATDLINGEPVKAVKLNGGLPQYTVGYGLDRTAEQESVGYGLDRTAESEEITPEDHISSTTQNVKINGKKGDTFSVGGWFKGDFDDNSIYNEPEKQYQTLETLLANSLAQIKVTYTYFDEAQQSITENFVVDFEAHNHDWQYAVDTFALKGDTESVNVTILAKNIPADCYVTGIELTMDNNSFSFIEDDSEAEIPETPEETETDDTENATPEECPCEECEELDCSCRCENADVCTCVQCLRRSDIETTSEDGKTITTSSYNGEKYMQSTVTYSDDMNNVISETDENNISSGYAYNVNGGLTSFTDGAGNLTNYQSNAMGYLTLAESNVSGLTGNAVKMAISYVYDGDLLTNVNQGNVQYTYEYDEWGQLNKVLVDGETLICYNYDRDNKAFRTRILNIVFGSSENSGFTVRYNYDLDGNIDFVEKYRFVEGEKDSINYYYGYDNLGNLISITDNGTGHVINYTDDGIVIKDGANGSVIYETKDVTPELEIGEDEIIEGEDENTDNETPEIVSITQEFAKGHSSGKSYNHKIYESNYSKETGKTTEKEAVSVVLSQDENNNFTYGKTIGTQTLSDWFGRNEAVTVMTKDPVDTSTDFASISSQYGYVTNGNVTTNLISSVTNTITGEQTNTVNYNYTYDSNGRITNILTASSVESLIGSSQYIYDEAGQLIKEITGSKIYEYAYDSKGNISTRKVYSGETLVSTNSFTYATSTWEDRLTSYNGEAITYDSIGNPVNYRGADLSWRGRELAGYIKGNKQISYSYDVDGMRYKKVVTEDNKTATYDYVYSDGTLILLTYTANGVSNTARFVYDSWGEPRGFMLNDSATYLYLKNAQGDITGIVDESGTVLLTYSYTAWGKVTYSATNMQNLILAGTLSKVNPFTYRGYCYDFDIDMYYLQSRYYDPETCRFINADSTDYLGATGTLLSYNLFAYCENDGVNFVDETGRSSRDYLKKQLSNFNSNKDSALKTFCKLLGKNGKNLYNAFHEFAQILIANKLSASGYSVTLEKACEKDSKKEMDVYATIRSRGGNVRKYVWEVKRKGQSAEKQIKTYLNLNSNLMRGFKLSTIKQRICKNLTMHITFNGKGGAFYSFYNDKNERISNAELKKAIQASVYKAIAVGLGFVTVATIVGVLVAGPGGGVVASTSAGSVSTGTLIVLVPQAVEAVGIVMANAA